MERLCGHVGQQVMAAAGMAAVAAHLQLQQGAGRRHCCKIWQVQHHIHGLFLPCKETQRDQSAKAVGADVGWVHPIMCRARITKMSKAGLPTLRFAAAQLRHLASQHPARLNVLSVKSEAASALSEMAFSRCCAANRH
jgi:hypothetical protein